MSDRSPLYTSSRWLTSCDPDAITRTGRLAVAWIMRSKKWQHFSTRVPPVFLLNRFQLLTLTRNGKRCSRMATIFTSPVVPAAISAINRWRGGMYRYSRPIQITCSAGRVATRSVISRQSSSVVHSGFSIRRWRPDSIAGIRMSWCVKFGEATTSASQSPDAISSSTMLNFDSGVSAPTACCAESSEGE